MLTKDAVVLTTTDMWHAEKKVFLNPLSQFNEFLTQCTSQQKRKPFYMYDNLQIKLLSKYVSKNNYVTD